MVRAEVTGGQAYWRRDKASAGRNPIEAGKNQTIEITRSEPRRRFSSRPSELMAQRQDLHLERSSWPEQPDDCPHFGVRGEPFRVPSCGRISYYCKRSYGGGKHVAGHHRRCPAGTIQQDAGLA